MSGKSIGAVMASLRSIALKGRRRSGLNGRVNRWAAGVLVSAVRGDCGAQLLEFALSLPFLLVLLVGIVDFGGAYNTRHILTNAAREAARITVSNPLNVYGATCSGDCSIQAAADAVKVYLVNAGLGQASCIDPTSSSNTGLTWTFTCNNVTLTINRGYVVTGGAGGFDIPSTQVTLSYPYTWDFGHVVSLLVRGTWATLPSSITTTVVMQQIAPG
jgi:Flp pilus assembly protein TadG